MNGKPKRVCLLTGASGRLGSMFCRLYGHRYEIAAVYRSQPIVPTTTMSWYVDPLDAANRKPASRPRFALIRADLSDPDEISRVVDCALDTFGRVDCLVNAAAYSRWSPLLSAEFAVEDVVRMLDMNAVVPLRLALELARRFWRGRVAENAATNRSIVNVSSTAAAYVFSDLGQSGYGASKAALSMLSCHMAQEFSAIGIRVNAVAPDSFPARVTTESVCDAIARVDRGTKTGEMLLLEPEGETAV
jgi:NAD(P)-dependent dehydrogenase (short-subunit alcohol dehydrogenase family)